MREICVCIHATSCPYAALQAAAAGLASIEFCTEVHCTIYAGLTEGYGKQFDNI